MSWDGKMYDKYRIEHMDGTPLKGKKYFVLRLDSDNPVEAARVAAAMRAYKDDLRNCDVGTSQDQNDRFNLYCGEHGRYCDGSPKCNDCPLLKQMMTNGGKCEFIWAQMPYEEGGAK